MTRLVNNAAKEETGWQARLNLAIARRLDRSVLVSRSHVGPLGIQRAFYPEGEVPHLYILHPPGGVVGGDQLQINVTVETGAHALITTPAAGKFYRCADKRGLLTQQLNLQGDACLEWLPQETIIYAGAEANSVTRVDLAADSRFIGWEMVCLGRPAANESFEQGYLRQRFELWREGTPLWLERATFAGGDSALSASWGLAHYPLSATMVVVGYKEKLTQELRAEFEMKTSGEQLAITQMDDLLVCRYLGHQAQQARKRLAAIWSAIRPVVMDRVACEPRVWNT